MAAAEYFSSAPMHRPTQSPYQQAPSSYSQSATSIPSANAPRPSMQSQAPPPYEQPTAGVHFAPTPTPQGPPQRHSFSGHQGPPPVAWNHSPQQGYGDPYPPQHMALQPYQQQPHSLPESSVYGTPPQQRPQYLTPHMRPYANPNSSHYSIESGGYSSDPEHNRRKHKHRHRRDSGETRSRETRSRETRSRRPSTKSSNSEALLGAAGGGIIGDLIFPGLGTVGGAVAGWIGGKETAHHRHEKAEKRHKEQKKWEEKFGDRHRHRSRSRSHDRRDSSAYLDVPARSRRHSEY